MPVIATNTSSNTALVYLNRNSADQERSLAKLSSGSRIVVASDDAAGLAVASRLKADVTTLNQAARNAVQAQSVLKTADGGLARIGDILQRMKSLAAQALSGSLDTASRGFIDAEYQQLLSEVDALAGSTTFNGVVLLDASLADADDDYLVGTDTATDLLETDLTGIDATATGLGINGGDVTTVANATTAADAVDAAIDDVSGFRAEIGSQISRFEYRADYIDTAIENLNAAASVILDTDIAAEQSNLVSKQVMTEAAIAALAQANQMKSSLLSLVR
ncbi:MAG: flagellin [Pseudomonadota bacterium]